MCWRRGRDSSYWFCMCRVSDPIPAQHSNVRVVDKDAHRAPGEHSHADDVLCGPGPCGLVAALCSRQAVHQRYAVARPLQVLFKQGDVSDAVVFVRTGCLELRVRAASGVHCRCIVLSHPLLWMPASYSIVARDEATTAGRHPSLEMSMTTASCRCTSKRWWERCCRPRFMDCSKLSRRSCRCATACVVCVVCVYACVVVSLMCAR